MIVKNWFRLELDFSLYWVIMKFSWENVAKQLGFSTAKALLVDMYNPEGIAIIAKHLSLPEEDTLKKVKWHMKRLGMSVVSDKWIPGNVSSVKQAVKYGIDDKFCPGCNGMKPLADFYVSRTTGRYHYLCKSCDTNAKAVRYRNKRLDVVPKKCLCGGMFFISDRPYRVFCLKCTASTSFFENKADATACWNRLNAKGQGRPIVSDCCDKGELDVAQAVVAASEQVVRDRNYVILPSMKRKVLSVVLKSILKTGD